MTDLNNQYNIDRKKVEVKGLIEMYNKDLNELNKTFIEKLKKHNCRHSFANIRAFNNDIEVAYKIDSDNIQLYYVRKIKKIS
jgi:predicted metal-dependent phosphoesterase TrpH